MHHHPFNIASRRKSTTSIREDIAQIYNLHNYPKSCHLIDVTNARDETIERPVSSIDDNHDESTSSNVSCGWYKRLKKKRWFRPLTKTILFILHFSVVFCVLLVGAMFLADIEDPPPEGGTVNESESNRTNGTNPSIWVILKEKYDIDIETEKRDLVIQNIENYLKQEQKKKELKLRLKERKDRSFIFWKWVYFMSVASTTIGYGDVTPVTDNGRFFYMIFSLVGIPLMVSLLKACGGIITAVNKRFFRFLNSCCFKDEPWVSEHFMTICSIILLFAGYVALGCVFNAALNGRPLFDSIYYWVVTFSTVGFGDIVQPLDDQVDWVIPLLIYRVFGLAMLAGVIDAIMEYISFRKEYINKKKKALLRKSTKRFASFRSDPRRKIKTPPPRPPLPGGTRKDEENANTTKVDRSREVKEDKGKFNRMLSPFCEEDERRSNLYNKFDEPLHEPIFGSLYSESGVGSEINDEYYNDNRISGNGVSFS